MKSAFFAANALNTEKHSDGDKYITVTSVRS